MDQLKITYQPLTDLTPRAGNPRTHSAAQITQIAKSITHFGFTNPILVDGSGGVIAGHGRLEAAKQLDYAEVPTISLAEMSEADIRAYVIADNRLAEQAGWDRALLAVEFDYLDALELDFDLTLTGFELPQIDTILEEVSAAPEEQADPGDEVPEPAGPAVTREGDLWQIGPHRLLCGDATRRASYEQLLDGELAQLVFTDPPYNVPVDGHVCGSGATSHREFAMASGEMSSEEFTAFLRRVMEHLTAASQDGAIHYLCMDWRHIGELQAAAEGLYSELKNLCVWAKTNGGMGSLYRSQHELIFVYKQGKAAHINNVELGKHGRYRTNVWSYPGVNSFGAAQSDLALHPTVKPVALVADALLDCSERGGLVLDAFAGSGTTLVAAARTGRRGFGLELDPLYCDTALRRLTEQIGLEARLAETGESFAEVAARRAEEEAAEAAPPEPLADPGEAPCPAAARAETEEVLS